jgi:predicted nucleic acid-binding protein
MARSQKAGLALGAMDAFVAATHALTLVTRNIKEFGHIKTSGI